MENINLDKIIKSDELDTNMILSVPEEIGIKLQRLIQGQATASEKHSTHMEIIENPSENIDLEESRKMIFKFNDVMLPITILDFPCIIEAQKTIDYKTFYKSGDIAQMMFVHDIPHKLNEEEEICNFDPFKANDQNFNKILWKKDYDHKYKLKNGLGKGTKNIRSKRFKRKIRYNQDEILEVAKKLKSIIDNGAASFENQNKNKESIMDTIENQSIIHSTSDYNANPIGNINNFNVPLPVQVDSKTQKLKKKQSDEFNVPMNKKNNLNINISLNSQNKSQTVNQNKIIIASPSNNVDETKNNEEQILIEEYLLLKSEYKKVKKELEKDELPDKEEKLRRKKKIKKRIKEIKKLYKQDNN